MHTKTDTQTAQVFKQPAGPQPPPKTPISQFLLNGEAIFTGQDVEMIETFGLSGWAVQQDITWQDQTLTDWPNLPSILRNTIITETLGPLQVPIRYALPYRYVGRVFTFAVLAESDPPIRVTQGRETPPRLSDMLVDPPVPFFTLGLASPEIVAKHARCVRQILTGGGNHNESILVQIPDILQHLCREGTITKSEAFYYLTGMHALASGSWRQLHENFGLLAVEHLIKHSSGNNPAQAQLLAQAHLIDGRSIEWPQDEDPFEVELQSR